MASHSSLMHCALRRRQVIQGKTRQEIGRRATTAKERVAPYGKWPSVTQARLEASMVAYFNRLGWRLMRNHEVQEPQFLVGYPLEVWKVSIPDYEGHPARISFKSLAELHNHWESTAATYVIFNNRELIFRKIYLASSENFRHSLKRWTEVGGQLPPKVLGAIEEGNCCPEDWSERVIELSPQLLSRPGLGAWDELRRRLHDFILLVDREDLAQVVPLPFGWKEHAARRL